MQIPPELQRLYITFFTCALALPKACKHPLVRKLAELPFNSNKFPIFGVKLLNFLTNSIVTVQRGILPHART